MAEHKDRGILTGRLRWTPIAYALETDEAGIWYLDIGAGDAEALLHKRVIVEGERKGFNLFAVSHIAPIHTPSPCWEGAVSPNPHAEPGDDDGG